jgi:hypothetical protein
MFQEQLSSDLEEITKILDESFNQVYDYCDQNPSNDLKNNGKINQGSTTIINNNYGSATYPFNNYYPIPLYYPTPVSQTIIYDSSTKSYSSNDDTDESKKSKSLSRGEVVAGAGGLGVVLLGSAYILSQDEYIKLYLSKIDDAIKSIKYNTVHETLCHKEDIDNIVKKYDRWLSMYQTRTLGKCQAKLAGAGSFATGIGGFMLYSNVVLFGGLFGGFACSGYLLWKYMTDNLRREKDAYISLRNDIKKLNDFIKTEKNHENASVPSAPPLFEVGSNQPPAYDEIIKSV